MCGIAGILGPCLRPEVLDAMLKALDHRGPDARAAHVETDAAIGLGQTRLRVIDLDAHGDGPLVSADERYVLAFNGEVYNHVELRETLAPYPFRTRTDTEVVLAAFARWGPACLERFIGMFAFAVFDRQERKLFAARDRFGVKPFLYTERLDGSFVFASEVEALRAGGVETTPDESTWATYLATGRSDQDASTFWAQVSSLPAGHALAWHDGKIDVRPWYDLSAAVGADYDRRPEAEVVEEYGALLEESVRLRFRSDVAVGVNLSGGLDSSTLVGLIRHALGAHERVAAFTFVCGDPRYDELPWVEQMLARTGWPLTTAELRAEEVPDLAIDVQRHVDEPFGGIPTLAYAKLFDAALRENVTVLLDGQGMDEQWAGYDTYGRVVRGDTREAGLVQGTRSSPVRPECLTAGFRERARDASDPSPFPDALRNAQLRDILRTKIPRALRFNDRVSMRASRELREPFLDHRLFELALRQPPERTNDGTQGKILLRRIAARVVPENLRHTPKRALQTPQREWLRGPLRGWTEALVQASLDEVGGVWLERKAVEQALRDYMERGDENSFYVWQWLNLGLMIQSDGWGARP